METYQVILTMPEIQTIRQSLELITIAGKDAKFLASLQTKLENEIVITNIEQNNIPGKKS